MRPAVKSDWYQYWEYVLWYVDDILCIIHKPEETTKGIQSDFKLKDENLTSGLSNRSLGSARCCDNNATSNKISTCPILTDQHSCPIYYWYHWTLLAFNSSVVSCSGLNPLWNVVLHLPGRRKTFLFNTFSTFFTADSQYLSESIVHHSTPSSFPIFETVAP